MSGWRGAPWPQAAGIASDRESARAADKWLTGVSASIVEAAAVSSAVSGWRGAPRPLAVGIASDRESAQAADARPFALHERHNEAAPAR